MDPIAVDVRSVTLAAAGAAIGWTMARMVAQATFALVGTGVGTLVATVKLVRAGASYEDRLDHYERIAGYAARSASPAGIGPIFTSCRPSCTYCRILGCLPGVAPAGWRPGES